ncbi:MAG: HlyD family efflux transporter periplasmic adaptor subunit [Acidobacteriota bacterium]|nr:HlyD family efflux transporter periplasmic adaptor subunit [Acidobacteriota bacterium]MDQ3171804.1 HlyD family efflux transporter periplasmic adaptor subunit [Acidobacteriota bacterium]
MVDIKRDPAILKKKRMRQSAFAVVGVIAIIMVTVAVSKLKPAAPEVERSTVWIDIVRQGQFTRQVRGAGRLVPEDIRWITATTSGRVERIVLRPGAQVQPGTVILELSNPQLQQSVMQARLNAESARAALINRRSELERQLLTQQSDLANLEAQLQQARNVLEAEEQLSKEGLSPEITLKSRRSDVQVLSNRVELAKKSLKMAGDGMSSQLAPQVADVNRLAADYQLRSSELAQLQVRSDMTGQLQALPVEVGQNVGAGVNIARVSNPTRLKAELQIAETQTRDLAIGQVADIDTRNGIVKGRVTRIDPAAQGGTVGVDITLEGALPAGARPDLSVDGTIMIEQVDNLVFVGAPAFGSENSTVMLFKLDGQGEAHRVQVRLGRRSVSTVEVIEGLKPGDQVILSDMSQYDANDRVRINN